MGLGNIVIGLTTAASATIGCAMYGVTDAKGTPLPGREIVWPATEVAAFYLGREWGLPDNDADAKIGAMYAVTTAVVGGAAYGLGYLVGSVTG